MKIYILFTLIFLATAASFAAPGDLDPTFSGDGKLIDNITGWDTARAVLIQPDGKILVAGGSGAYPPHIVLARYFPDGSPDLAFGDGGKVRTIVDNYFEISSIALQPDEEIIVVASNFSFDNYYFLVGRYLSNGTLDTFVGESIGEDGNYPASVIIQPDGKVVVAGTAQSYYGGPRHFFLVRYQSDLSRDLSFGIGGKVETTISGDDSAYSAAIQPDGKIVAAGSSFSEGKDRFALVRYMPNGSLDPGFGVDGKVITKFSSAIANSVVLQPDGKIIAAGGNHNGWLPGFALARYQANGSLDMTFGSNGRVTTPILGGGNANSVALQPDGMIVAVGSYAVNGDFVLTRYDPRGSLDRSFGGGDGIATVDFDHSFDEAYALALDSTGRAVVAGASSPSYANYQPRFAIARFLLNSDTAFPSVSP